LEQQDIVPKKKLSLKDQVESRKKLQKIYDVYGANSSEFYIEIKNLLIYLLNRYMGRYDEDCLGDCYVRLLESFKYWDKSKSNIISWIHLVVRNRISTYCYNETKKMREGYEYNDKITEGKQSNHTNVMDMLETQCKSLIRIHMDAPKEFTCEVFYMEHHPFFKSSLWSIYKEAYSWKKPKKFNISMK